MTDTYAMSVSEVARIPHSYCTQSEPYEGRYSKRYEEAEAPFLIFDFIYWITSKDRKTPDHAKN